MKKYNCNNTLDYAHEEIRMCRAFDKCGGCDGCPLVKKSCCGIFDVTPEHINRVQAWSDAHPEIRLTDEQHEVLKALDLLGFRYIAKDADGKVDAYTHQPGKCGKVWVYTAGECVRTRFLRAEVFATIAPLVSWSDKEPLNIAAALEQAEEVHP